MKELIASMLDMGSVFKTSPTFCWIVPTLKGGVSVSNIAFVVNVLNARSWRELFDEKTLLARDLVSKILGSLADLVDWTIEILLT